jgi:GntR family transcriptional regulator/MocR family aminotransferase
LREALAAHLAVARGVQCQADQIIIVAGAQAGFDLAARLLLNPGDLAWIEEPGYFGARYAFQNAGIQLALVRVNSKEGLEVLAGKTEFPQARLAIVTPSHQFPTGVTMSLAQRLALLEWANQTGAWIIEDDYDSEFRFGGRPLEALQGLDKGRHVLYVGTFSKVLFPALRLGYLVVPPALVDAFLKLRRFVDTQPPILDQMVVAEFIEEGHFLRHIRRMRQIYKSRRDVLVEMLQSQLRGLIGVSKPEAGMHLVGWLAPGMDDQQVAKQAAAKGLEVVPISSLSLLPPTRAGLMLGYAAVDEKKIRVGVSTLSEILIKLKPLV